MKAGTPTESRKTYIPAHLTLELSVDLLETSFSMGYCATSPHIENIFTMNTHPTTL